MKNDERWIINLPEKLFKINFSKISFNLIKIFVSADSISQYDAIRAYLKEMDISNSVWIGLSKTSEKPNFTWT